MKTQFSMGAVSAATFAEMCGGDLREGRGADTRVWGMCTDSREADKYTVFCALRGERVDGHDYIAAAIAAGCRCVLCEQTSEEIEAAGIAAVVVKDTEMALSRFANACRHALTCRTVAVTGSVGKTTTKDLLASVLSVRANTFCTPGNHNSLVGMPLAMTEIPADTAWAVLEMGMSGFGEIERLSVAAEPELAIMTSIGSSHIGSLGSRENICRAKLEVLCGLRTGGILLLNGDEPLLAGIGGKSYRTMYVSLQRENTDFSAKNIRVENNRTLFDVTWAGGCARDLCVRVMGRHNVYAALFAFAVGILGGMDPEDIRAGLLAFEPDGLRQHMTSCGEWELMEDCYNASPESMDAAIEVLHDYCLRTGRRSVAVLGDMLELGADSAAMHRRVGAHLAYLGVARLLTVGKGGAQIALGARQMGMETDCITRCADPEEPEAIARTLSGILQPGDVVLFKASRAVGEERIIQALRHLNENQPEHSEV